MALTNKQYDILMREYDNIRTANQHILNERYEEVYRLAPEYSEIEQEIINISMDAARERILGSNTASSLQDASHGNDSPLNKSGDLQSKLSELNNRKTQCLTRIGKPADYLSPVYTCPLCKDSGYIGQERCSCFKKKAIDLVYQDSNLKNITESENFDTFSYEWYADDSPNSANGLTPLQNAKQAVAMAKEFTVKFDEEFSNILLYGTTGAGKTFLTNCIARELLNSTHSVIYLTAVEFFDKLSNKDFNKDYGKADTSDRFDTDYLTECDLLIIDDLGTEMGNSYTASKLFYIINERLLRKKSVIISTNLSLKELQDTYSDRVFSRITSAYKCIRLFGDDIRILKATR